MPGYTYPKWKYEYVENFRVYLKAKINFITHVFLEILQRYANFFILGTLGMPGNKYPNWYYQLVENFDIYLQAKNTLHRSLLYWGIRF